MNTDNLTLVYGGLELEWIEKNHCVFENANKSGLAVAGSIAMAVACKKAKKAPKDIDFVCCSVNDAMAFISSLQSVLMGYNSHWRIYVNHDNDFVPPGCQTHFRFQCAFWLPICIMVIPAEKFQFWFAKGEMRVQRFDFAKDAAKELEKVDNKDRTSDFVLPPDEEVAEPQGTPTVFVATAKVPPSEGRTYRKEP